MAALAFRQRESHGAMTNTTLLPLQDQQHGYLCFPSLALEKAIVTIAAIQPFRVLPMRESNRGHAAIQIQDDVLIELADFHFLAQSLKWLDLAFFKRLDPAHLIACCIRRQF